MAIKRHFTGVGGSKRAGHENFPFRPAEFNRPYHKKEKKCRKNPKWGIECWRGRGFCLLFTTRIKNGSWIIHDEAPPRITFKSNLSTLSWAWNPACRSSRGPSPVYVTGFAYGNRPRSLSNTKHSPKGGGLKLNVKKEEADMKPTKVGEKHENSLRQGASAGVAGLLR